MIRFPFFGYSYPYHYYPRYSPTPLVPKIPNKSSEEAEPPSNPEKMVNTRKVPSENNPITFHYEGFSDPNQVILEILGIKLYLDDLIILGLIFILYQEEVKDEMLFICLILLLLS